MVHSESLGKAMGAIEAIEQRIAGIVHSEPDAWRFKLVEARRDLSQAMQALAEAIAACEHAELRDKFSAYRHTLAVHHASHPVCVISEAADYRSSAARVGQARRILADCAQQVMAL